MSISRHGLYWSALVQLSGSKINVELYRRFIPRDEDFISWQGTMWLIVCGYVWENIRNWFVYFVVM